MLGAFAEAAARAGEVVVLAGDFNLQELELAGYSAGAAGIDHVLVRGAAAIAAARLARASDAS